jgi:hypothetical protein
MALVAADDLAGGFVQTVMDQVLRSTNNATVRVPYCVVRGFRSMWKQFDSVIRTFLAWHRLRAELTLQGKVTKVVPLKKKVSLWIF